MNIEAAFFDVDGVLLDSLAAHLAVCRDEAERLNVAAHVPDVQTLREQASGGAVLSPMEELFHTVGFERSLARIADQHYRAEFASKYPVGMFTGVPQMLEQLVSAGLRLGIVTANTRSNIEAGLGETLGVFDERCIFIEDPARRLTKASALIDGARECGVSVQAVVYVGDQLRDYVAAQTAGTQFLGVSYGWGILGTERRFPLVHSPEEVANYLLAAREVARSR
jgi:phosphoglycolate phosphatase-like HAD superfamily hydrolase